MKSFSYAHLVTKPNELTEGIHSLHLTHLLRLIKQMLMCLIKACGPDATGCAYDVVDMTHAYCCLAKNHNKFYLLKDIWLQSFQISNCGLKDDFLYVFNPNR